jgi:transcriptional regulator with XRE-family HTH domain
MGMETEILPLREWRLRHYLSYRRLAKRAGVSTETLQRAERGMRTHEITQRRIADALGVPVSQIAEFTQTKTNA